MKFISMFPAFLVGVPVLSAPEGLRKTEETFGSSYYPPQGSYRYGPGFPQCASGYAMDDYLGSKLTFEFNLTRATTSGIDPDGTASGSPTSVGHRLIVHAPITVVPDEPSYYGYPHYPQSYGSPYYHSPPAPVAEKIVGTLSIVSTAVSCEASSRRGLVSRELGDPDCEVIHNGVLRFNDPYFCKGSISFSIGGASLLPTPLPDDVVSGVTGGNKDFGGANGVVEINFISSIPNGANFFYNIIVHPFAPSKKY